MANASDPLAGSQEKPAEPSALPGAMAPPPPVDAYRPLSMLALAGFALGAFYALVVVAGGLVSFFLRVPWLLSFWAVLLPTAGFILSWLAWRGIRDSEGTLTGEGLANTGMALSVVFGLTYGAYYMATYVAVRQQARNFVEKVWLERVRNGEIEKAFLLTLGPPRPAEDAPDLRTTLETLHNTPRKEGSGAFTAFSQGSLVRFIQSGGPSLELVPLGVQSLAYEKGGYNVALLYRLKSPSMDGNIYVTVKSAENPSKGAPGRQWYVVRDETGPSSSNDRPEPTPEGRSMLSLAQEANNFTQEWLNAVTRDPARAFLDTQVAADRFRLRQGLAYSVNLPAKRAVLGLAYVAAEPPATREFRAGMASFRNASVLKMDPPEFWCPEKLGRDFANAMKAYFRMPATIIPKVERVSFPLFQEIGERILFRVDVSLTSGVLVGDGQLLISTGKSTDDLIGRRVWRVEGLELHRGRVQEKLAKPGAAGPGG